MTKKCTAYKTRHAYALNKAHSNENNQNIVWLTRHPFTIK